MNELRIITGHGSIDLLNPTPDDVNMVDVCLNLSRIRRWNGAIDFTVGQHSRLVEAILKANGANQATCLAGLLHDAHEYATGDVPGPVLKTCYIYELKGLYYQSIPLKSVQTNIQNAIHNVCRLATSDVNWNAVDAADMEARACEVWYLLPQSAPRRNLIDTQFQTEPDEPTARNFDAILNGNGSLAEHLAAYGISVEL